MLVFGALFYKTSSSSNGKLSFLKNKIGVFETEVVDESGNSIENSGNGNSYYK